MRHFKKRVLALLLAGAVGIGNYASVSASAIKDAQDKKDEAQQELNQVNQQIQNIQSAQNSLQAEMNNYDNQLMSLLTDMDILQSDMDTQEHCWVHIIGQENIRWNHYLRFRLCMFRRANVQN